MDENIVGLVGAGTVAPTCHGSGAWRPSRSLSVRIVCWAFFLVSLGRPVRTNKVVRPHLGNVRQCQTRLALEQKLEHARRRQG
ncbi:hypothetical protein ACVMB1_001600 [Bradyrhizobium sp. USDA 4504]